MYVVAKSILLAYPEYEQVFPAMVYASEELVE